MLVHYTGNSGGVLSKLNGAASIMEWLVQAKMRKAGNQAAAAKEAAAAAAAAA
eukprot:CAMPEP_0172738108 /NCGR_PEP_ID=MMETSP1074-20121228/119449_1 /TAXON_ID=2916 /ORGANISM="Ceratium fusus, Strain PA161109" /LENGTH=52 /DNA_ID=CAMNT_0013567679 /DNA_START=124 /DNA_END=279 /DNA_ORIENTATION=+